MSKQISHFVSRGAAESQRLGVTAVCLLRAGQVTWRYTPNRIPVKSESPWIFTVIRDALSTYTEAYWPLWKLTKQTDMHEYDMGWEASSNITEVDRGGIDGAMFRRSKYHTPRCFLLSPILTVKVRLNTYQILLLHLSVTCEGNAYQLPWPLTHFCTQPLVPS